MPATKARANFDYFLQQRQTRLRGFRDFMKKFGVDATTTDDGLAAVSGWFEHYGGLLLHFQPYDTSTLGAFVGYDPPWQGKYIGTNVVWDIGTYIGECIIERSKSAYWDLDTGDPDPISLESLGYHRPHISRLGWPPSRDPITQVFMTSQSRSREMRIGYQRAVRFGDLVELVATWSGNAPSS